VTEPKAITNPFPGLRPFETDEYRLFFGREGQSDALIERLQRARFLAVVGTSGSGKSSLVRAGLLPALRGGMMAGAGAGWRVAVMRPGHDPIGNLARELAGEGVLAELGAGLARAEGEAVVEATLRRGSLGLVDAVRQARIGAHEKLLVVVDQFEELFRFRTARMATDTDDDASAFVKLLLEARQSDKPPEERMPIYVVLTMRSDFLGDCAQFQGLPEAINDGQYLIPRMTRDERRFAISGPVRVARGKISEPLVNRLLNDVGDNPDQLPILQHALMRTWDYWQRRRSDGEAIGLDHYAAVGTMSDALSLHADEAWGELPDERSRYIAEVLFKALTERGADNREIRRPTSLSVVCRIADASEAEVVAVIEIFRREGRSFLMPPAGVEITSETVIDISHESLIRNWDRLKAWVKDEAEAARIYRRLAEAAAAYRTGEGGLLDEVTLQWVQKWRDKYAPTAAWGMRYHPEFDAAIAYLEESRAARDAAVVEAERRQKEELERERREREQAELFAQQQRRSARRMRWLAAGMAVMFILALGGAAYAYTMSRVARQRESEAKELQVAAQKSEREVRVIATRLAEEKKVSDEMAESLKAAKKDTDKALEAEKAAVIEQEKALDAQKIATARANEQTRKATENSESFKLSLERSAANVIGGAAFRREDYSNALIMFTRAIDIVEKEQARAAGDEKTRVALTFSRIALLSNLGATQRKLGESDGSKFDEAVKSYEDASALMSKITAGAEQKGGGRRISDDGRWLLFDIYHGLAHAYRGRGNHAREAAAAAPAPAEVKEEDIKENNYNDYAEAEDYFKKALDIQEKLLKDGDPSRLASGYENLARLYRDLGKYEEAEPVYKKILELREKLSDEDEYVATLKEVAQFYIGQNRYDDAAVQYEKVLSIQEKKFTDGDTREVSDLRDLADSYSDLGEVYVGLKNEPKAKSLFQLASALQDFALKQRRIEKMAATDSSGDNKEIEGMYEALENLGDLFMRAGRYGLAEGAYAQVAAVRRSGGKDVAKVFMKLGHLNRFHLKNYAEAVEFYEGAVDMLANNPQKEPQLLGDALTQLGGLYAEELNKPADAEQFLNQALEYVSTASNMERAKYETLSALAGLYQKQNKTADLVRVSRDKLKVAGELLKRTSGNTVEQKAWDASAYAEAFGLYIRAVSDLSDAFRAQGDAEAARAVYSALLDGELDVSQVVDESVLDAYARMLETNSDYLSRMVRDPSETDNVAERIKKARAKQSQIEQINHQQQIRQEQTYAPAKSP
jgi:tetratricopeptide (TPR) repeat protein